MKTQTVMSLAMAAALILCATASAEDVQWVRVTVLLEPANVDAVLPRDTLIPGGVYSEAEVDARRITTIDREIVDRVRSLDESMQGIEESMRLTTLLPRQYYLALEVGRKVALPVIDLNPRLAIVLEPVNMTNGGLKCKVQFLEPEGPAGTTEFTGTPITLRLQEADLREVLQMFASVVPFELEVDPSVAGTVTVDLRDVPWDQALDLVLRTNNLGWVRDDGTLRVGARDEMTSHQRVRADAIIGLAPGVRGPATVASRGDEHSPTVVLLIERVGGSPGSVAERDGLVHASRVLPVSPYPDDLGNGQESLAIFRATVATDGSLRDAAVLASPSEAYAKRLLAALETWRFQAVLDEAGRKQEGVVGYGVRLSPPTRFVNLGEVAHIGVDVTAEPAPEPYPDQYVIKVVITDLETGKVLTAPQMVTRRGDEARVGGRVQAPNGEGSTMNMRFLVSEDGKTVSYSWTMITAGTIVASNSAEFTL
jgi:hypothetical protein